MEYFKKYHSNTTAGSGSQYFFINESDKPTKSCTLYRVSEGGEYPYSFLISNTIDGTFADGKISHKNLVVDSWVIDKMQVGVSSRCDKDSFAYPVSMKAVTFDGKAEKNVNPGELFCTDPVILNAKAGEYICVEITFSGKMIPNHEESMIPSFILKDGEWVASKKHPYVAMVGAELDDKKKIAYLGDSITQGCGTPVNSYTHWNAVLSERLGNKYSYWNIGLGYGRADDAASDGMWLYKAKQNDIVFVCYGVNDINRGFSADAIKKNLQTIVDKLCERGIRVFIQTVPPFNYPPERTVIWKEVNEFIKNEIQNVEFVFDCTAILSKSEEEPQMAKYGGHPDSNGCKIWGEALYDAIKDVL